MGRNVLSIDDKECREIDLLKFVFSKPTIVLNTKDSSIIEDLDFSSGTLDKELYDEVNRMEPFPIPAVTANGQSKQPTASFAIKVLSSLLSIASWIGGQKPEDGDAEFWNNNGVKDGKNTLSNSYLNVTGPQIMAKGFSSQLSQSIINSPLLAESLNRISHQIVDSEIKHKLIDPDYYDQRLEIVRKWLEKQSRNYLLPSSKGSILCGFEHINTLRLAYVAVVLALTKLYNKGVFVLEEDLISLKKLAVKAYREKRSIIFLPCHKSHVDYMVVHLLCFRFGISLPLVIAGNNLNVPIFGPALKNIGAIFIKRRHVSAEKKSSTNILDKEDYIYDTVLRSYLNTSLKNGINLEVFIEGSRSRSGKLLSPKLGILKIILETFSFIKNPDGTYLIDESNDAYIVPISTQYDKVLETNEYVSELLGSEKISESFQSIFFNGLDIIFSDSGRSKEKTAATDSYEFNFSHGFGRMDIRMSSGWSLKEFLQEEMRKASHDSDDQILAIHRPEINQMKFNRILNTLGYKVLNEINKISIIMPTAIVGTVLSSHLNENGKGIANGGGGKLSQSRHGNPIVVDGMVGIGHRELVIKTTWLVLLILCNGGNLGRSILEPVHQMMKASGKSFYEDLQLGDLINNRTIYETMESMVEESIGVLGHNIVFIIGDSRLKLMSGKRAHSAVTFKTLEPIYCVVDSFQLAYYRNMLIHLFISESIVCVVLHSLVSWVYATASSTDAPPEAVLSIDDHMITLDLKLMEKQVQSLSQLLSKEFVYDVNGIVANLLQTIVRLSRHNIMTYDFDKGVVYVERALLQRNVIDTYTYPDSSTGNALSVFSGSLDIVNKLPLVFFCCLLWPFIDSYWVVLLSVQRYLDSRRSLSESEFLNEAQTVARTLFHQGKLEYYEAVSRETMRHAVDEYEKMSILKRQNGKLSLIDKPQAEELLRHVHLWRRRGYGRGISLGLPGKL